MRRLAIFIPVLAILLLPAALTAQDDGIGMNLPGPGTRGRPTARFQVSGTVRDDASNRSVENVRVDLRQATGATFATAFTNSNGDFTFNDVRGGNYFLVIEAIDYQPFNQQIAVEGQTMGLEVWLHSSRDPKPTSKSGTVSARELNVASTHQKAHEEMQKGLELLYQKSDFRGSLARFQRAVKDYPDYYEAYAQMGMAYMNLGDTVNSEQSLRKSIEVSKERYVDAYCMLATLLSSGNRFTDAEALARKATEIDGNSWQANFELARALYGMQQFAEAEKSAQAASELKPDNITLYLLLADIQGRLGKFPAVLADLNAYLKIAPPSPTADHARAMRDRLQDDLANDPPQDAAPAPDAARPTQAAVPADPPEPPDPILATPLSQPAPANP